MVRNAFAQLSKITDCAGRIDYMSNPDRQEHLYTTYSTIEDDSFWTELAATCHKEHDKYSAGGKVVEAREWIIALEESLLELDPDMVIRKFVDAFHEKYGVECKAALHHNSSQTNYHIHMLFSERKLLAEPIEKKATRNMFFDENRKHKRTKKEILDGDGNIRPGCKIVAKGEIYERQIFSEKNPYFKSITFRKEAQELFKNVNNSFITDEDRKLSIFNPESVYLATKKVGKNNPMAEYIIADNEVRKEWNMSVDQALIALVDRNDILDVKEKNILGEIRRSIAENGIAPGLFSTIVGKAVTLVKEMMHKSYDRVEAAANDTPISVTEVETKTVKSGKIPPKPKKPSGIEEFEYYQSIFNEIKRYGGKIRANEKNIDALEAAVKTCSSVLQILEKRQYEKDIKRLKADNEGFRAMQENILKQYGYYDVDAFMKLYWITKNAKEGYEKKLAAWSKKYGYGDGDSESPKTITYRMSNAKKKVKEYDLPEPSKKKGRNERMGR